MTVRNDEILTSREARELLKIGRTKLWELTRRSSIPAYRIGEGRTSSLRCSVGVEDSLPDQELDESQQAIKQPRHFVPAGRDEKSVSRVAGDFGRNWHRTETNAVFCQVQ